MPSVITFLSVDSNECDEILSHLELDSHQNVHHESGGEERYWYKDFGPLGSDLGVSPVVRVYRPRQQLDKVWTMGMVEFSPFRLRERFPPLNKIRNRLDRALKKHPVVWWCKTWQEGDFNYYLEGSILNHDFKIYGLPSALKYMESGGYFINATDDFELMEPLRRQLALRGVAVPGIEFGG